MRKFWRFNGGLKLDRRKELSSDKQLVTARVPKQLIYPMQQRSNVFAKPVVSIGDRVRKGQLIAGSRHMLAANIHAASSGIVGDIRELPAPHPSGLSDLCIIIDTDGRDEPVRTAGTPDWSIYEPEYIRRLIHEAGIVGLGGAAFPTSIKLKPGKNHSIDTLILNGAECEPYITCDDCLLLKRPYDVLESAKILLHVLRIERCIISIEDDVPETQRVLEAAASKPGYEHIEIACVPTRYPTGGEKQLIRVLTGREVPSGGIPADVGIVSHNVGTAAAIYHAICLGEPLISRIVTVTGQGVKDPKNMVVRLGTPIKDLIEQCGGYTDDVYRLIMGGPMMGFTLPDDGIPVIKATNCILAADRSEVAGEKQAMPCIRCGECARSCPVNLLPQQLYWYGRAGNLEKAKEYSLSDCIECGCCEIVCPSHIPLVQYFRATKSEITIKSNEAKRADLARRRHEAQVARKAREQAEKAERARQKKALLEKKKASKAPAAPVPADNPPGRDGGSVAKMAASREDTGVTTA
ncbi:MAG: electron transport complex subunit RsxC [Pseudomonadota bacterium]